MTKKDIAHVAVGLVLGKVLSAGFRWGVLTLAVMLGYFIGYFIRGVV